MRSEQAWRQPTETERAILDKLLAVDFDGREAARAQAEDCLVRAGCGCGCPSLDIKVSTHHPLITDSVGSGCDAGVLRKLDVEATARETDSSPAFLIFLFERDGRLAELEFAPFADGEYQVPAVEDIEVFLDDPSDWTRVDGRSP